MRFEHDFEHWSSKVPESIAADPLWRTPAYRFALFLQAAAREDLAILDRDRHARLVADQLWRAVSSISANLAEGYSRLSPRERARFYEYAMGSAREARTWYFTCQPALGPSLAGDRLECLARITRILLAVISRERVRT